jgi:hypothetical protein
MGQSIWWMESRSEAVHRWWANISKMNFLSQFFLDVKTFFSGDTISHSS